MKTFRYINLLAIAFLTAGALGFSSCADEWNSHYEGDGSVTAADQPSLYELIKADGTLKEFVRVLDNTGYDKVLNGSQALTVWAPALTTAQADSIIALYNSQKQSIITMPDGSQRYIQDKDNKAITQFLQNHMALYGRTVYEGYSDSLRLMNGKYVMLHENDVNGIPFARKNIVASNGVLYVLQSVQPFSPSVRESLALDADLDSVASFYELLDQYNLDEASSVQRGIVDGRIVYADSVLTLSNQLYSTLGWINREDSSYLFLAPTNEVWASELERFKPMFHYVADIQNRDSVALLNAKMAIIGGRIFNMNDQRGKTVEEADTLINTLYVRHKDYYGLNVFDKTALLGSLTPWYCSNGRVYKDAEGRIDPQRTILEARYLSATSPRDFQVAKLAYNGEIFPSTSASNQTFIDTVTFEGVRYETEQLKKENLLRGENFLELAPLTYQGLSPANITSRVYFYLPNTFANLYYNVYAVMVPSFLALDGYNPTEVKPVPFRVYFHERLETARESYGNDQSMTDSAFLQRYPNEDLLYETQNKDAQRYDAAKGTGHMLSVPADETHKYSDTEFLASGRDIEVICLQKAMHPQFSSYNFLSYNNDPVIRYSIESSASSVGMRLRGQTNVLRINRLIYIPFETEQDALNYQLDLSNLKEYN